MRTKLLRSGLNLGGSPRLDVSRQLEGIPQISESKATHHFRVFTTYDQFVMQPIISNRADFMCPSSNGLRYHMVFREAINSRLERIPIFQRSISELALRCYINQRTVETRRAGVDVRRKRMLCLDQLGFEFGGQMARYIRHRFDGPKACDPISRFLNVIGNLSWCSSRTCIHAGKARRKATASANTQARKLMILAGDTTGPRDNKRHRASSTVGTVAFEGRHGQ